MKRPPASASWWLILHDVEDGDSEDDDGHQFDNQDPTSLAPSAQADGDDNQRDGEDKQEQRDHADASMRAKPLRATYRLYRAILRAFAAFLCCFCGSGSPPEPHLEG